MARWFAAAAAFVFLACVPAFAAQPPIETYGRLPQTEFVALSPSGQRIAYVATAGDNRKLIVRTTDGTTLQTTDLRGDKPRQVIWAGEDHVILRTTMTEQLWGGEPHTYETFRTFVLNLKTKDLLVLFKGSTQAWPAETGFYGTREVDGHWFGYFSALPRRTSRDVGTTTFIQPALFRVELDLGGDEKIVNAVGWALAADGTVAAHVDFDTVADKWKLITGVAGRHLAEIDDYFHDSSLLGMGRTPGTVIYSRQDSPTGALLELPVSGEGAPVGLPGDIDSRVIEDVDGRAIGLSQEGDRLHPQFFDPTVEKKVNAVVQAFQPNAVDIESWSRDFNRIVVRSNGADDAGTYYLVDIPGQKVDMIGKAYPTLGAGQIGPTRMVGYKAGDGTALQGVLTLPPGPETRNRPLIVLPHDQIQQRDHLGFHWLAQAFASRGYVVFQPNYRGSTGYGLALRKAGYGELGKKMQSDIADGVAELARQGIADAKRACIVGQGYGGYAALAGVTVQQGQYRCAVGIGAVTDLSGLYDWGLGRYGRTGDGIRKFERRLGLKGGGGSALDAYSPSALAAKADAPVLLVYGKEDTTIPASQSETMAKALENAGKPVKLVVLKDEDHWLSRETTRLQALTETIAFVEKNDPPG